MQIMLFNVKTSERSPIGESFLTSLLTYRFISIRTYRRGTSKKNTIFTSGINEFN